jgi:hypothetical protein
MPGDLPRRWDETLSRIDGAGDGSATIGQDSTATVDRRPAGGIVVPAAGRGRTLADEFAGRAPLPLPDRFRLLRRTGGDGRVDIHLAEQTALGREVELRILRDPADRAGIAGLARLLARLDHPGVVPVHDAGDDLLILGSARGESLAALAAKSDAAERLPVLVEALARACETIAFAHSRGVLHRNLTPGAILVGGFGEVWVRDWDQAVELVGGRARLGSPAEAATGTPAWMAPECARGEAAAVTAAADVFQLGALLFLLLTRRPPFAAGSAWESLRLAAAGQVPAAAVAAPGCPPVLAATCDRACSADPARRGEAAGLAKDLRAWLHARAVAAEADRLAIEADRLSREAGADVGWMAAVAAAERALGLVGDHPAALAARRQAVSAWGRAALGRGDRWLAAALAARAEDAGLRAAVADAESRLRHSARRRRLATVAGLVIAAALGSATAALLWWSDATPGRDRAAAERLLHAAQQVRGSDDAAWSGRMALLRAADAADPGIAAQALAGTAETWGATVQDGDLALILADQAERGGGQASGLRADAQRWQMARRAAAEAAAARWRPVVMAAGPGPAAAVATAPAGELAAAATAWAEGPPADRRAAAILLARRDDLPSGPLVRLLGDDDPEVVGGAVRAVAQRSDAGLLPRAVAALRRMAAGDLWRARLMGTVVGPAATTSLRSAAFAPTAEDLVLIGDIEGRIAAAEEAATRAGGLGLTDAVAAARLALFNRDQADRALALLAGLPADPAAAVVRAQAWLRLGHPAKAAAELGQATDNPETQALRLLTTVRQHGAADVRLVGNLLACRADAWGDGAPLAARALREAGRRAEADAILTANAGRWRAWLDLAEQAWRSGDVDRARRIDALICERFPYLSAPCRQAAAWCTAEGAAAEAAAWQNRNAAGGSIPGTDDDG